MRVFIAYDGSTFADAALEDLQSAGLPHDSEARVLTVADFGLVWAEPMGNVEGDYPEPWATKLSDAEKFVQAACERVRKQFPRWTVSAETLPGSPAKTILQAAHAWHPDLIVIGSHGHSLVRRLFLGSVSLELVHNAPCSVRLGRSARTPIGARPVRIVIGVDGSPSSNAMILSIANRSWPESAEAQIISAVQTFSFSSGMVAMDLAASTYANERAYAVIREADELERARLRSVAQDSADILRRAGLNVTCSVLDGDPREMILTAAEDWQAEGIFVGVRGMGRMDRLLLGSVSSHIVTHAHCTVEVVRQAA